MDQRPLVKGRILLILAYFQTFLSFCVLYDFFHFSKKSDFGVFLVHPPMASVLLSASVERCFVSRMRDFFVWKWSKIAAQKKVGTHASRWIRDLWLKGVSLILAYLQTFLSFCVLNDFFLFSKKIRFPGGPRIPNNPIFLKNGKNHPKRKNSKTSSDMPKFDQRSLIHREVWFLPCFVRQNRPKNKLFLARRFKTIFKQKCSNMRHLLSTTFPQGFRISKNIGHPTSGSGGKKTYKRYLKSEHTDKQTDKHTDGHLDLQKASAQRADALKTNRTAFFKTKFYVCLILLSTKFLQNFRIFQIFFFFFFLIFFEFLRLLLENRILG